MTPMIVRATPWLRCGREAQGLDPLEDVVDDLRGRMRLQNDDHEGPQAPGRVGRVPPDAGGRPTVGWVNPRV